MKLIHSKDIYYIMRDVLKSYDPKVINHGIRTAYVFSRMLMCMDKYEMYEIAEFGYIATFHDIGAYKTDQGKDQLQYETKEYVPHSIYGYLFLLYLTPFKDRAKLLLYHHTDYSKMSKHNPELDDVICSLNLAEKIDLYSNILGSKFDYQMFEKQSGTKFSPRALDYLYQAEKKFNIIEKLSTGEYKQELAALFEYLIFTNEEKHDLLQGLMYCLSFRSEYTMLDVVTCVNVAEQIGEKMSISKNEMELLHYAALLHDAGMCTISKDILEAPRKLTDEEMQTLRGHVGIIESILKGRIDQECLDIITAHHERGDGSGYPKRLREHQLNKLQKILQVADTITGLTNRRSYREPKPKAAVIAILKEEADKGRLGRDVVRTTVSYYDEIMEHVGKQNADMLSMYKKLRATYEETLAHKNI